MAEDVKARSPGTGPVSDAAIGGPVGIDDDAEVDVCGTPVVGAGPTGVPHAQFTGPAEGTAVVAVNGLAAAAFVSLIRR